ncbi:MAG: ATP-grasp domain-containing protein, partial [Pirellula sp.]|nr:ATP-grasp domain-containing protein [Pirellula sp.]
THTVDEWLRSHSEMIAENATIVSQTNPRWLWKKQRSAGGLGVKFVDSKELEEPSLLRANGLSESGVLQEHVSGKSIGVSFLSSHHGTVILGVAESLPLQPHIWSDFIYRGSIAPVSIPQTLVPSINDFASTVVRSTGWCGVWQADFLLCERDLYLLEINPRWTASMELLEYGYDLPLVTWHMSCAQFEKSTWNNLQKRLEKAQQESLSKFRKEIRYAEEDGFVSAEEADEWWGQRWIARTGEAKGLWYADIPQAHVALTRGAPVCSIIERVD